eukprot:GGOE01013861.1.p3 GENE.GGOE01013861.1~~GGOE01013861.1.p3  ORF type:complete len:194 (-),score=51.20 GGOE01013861.1:293-874(-)
MPRNGQSQSRVEEESSTYIRPTQGLKVRQPGGVLNVSLENIGGRIMYMEEMVSHKVRMDNVKPVVSIRPPWGHEAPQSTPPKGKSKAKAAKQKEPGEGKKGLRRGQPSSPDPEALAHSIPEYDVGVLSEEHQRLYDGLVRMLCSLTNADSRALLEQAYRESEERKLLSGYTGIFPTLDAEEDFEVAVGEEPTP